MSSYFVCMHPCQHLSQEPLDFLTGTVVSLPFWPRSLLPASAFWKAGLICAVFMFWLWITNSLKAVKDSRWRTAKGLQCQINRLIYQQIKDQFRSILVSSLSCGAHNFTLYPISSSLTASKNKQRLMRALHVGTIKITSNSSPLLRAGFTISVVIHVSYWLTTQF